jgi:flavin-dependent thymidylate synthase
VKVTLIDYTGNGNPDPHYAARLLVYTKNTRLTQGEATRAKVAAMDEHKLHNELSYVADTIRSSWEFISYTWEVTGVTRAYTHQQVRSRHGKYAQQAQRVVDMTDFETLVPATVMMKDKGEQWQQCMFEVGHVYEYYKNSGVPAQDCRGVLPTNVLTNIIVNFDLRNFADLCGKRENLRAQGEYADVVRAMKAEVLRVHPWTKPFLEPDRLATPAIDQMLSEALGKGSPIDKPLVNKALKELDKLKGTWG